MVLLFYSVLNVIVLSLFLKYWRKNLHVLEVLVYWLLASYLVQNFSALCYMNFKTLIIPEKLSFEFAHVLNRLVFYPILMVSFLNYFLFLTSKVKKLLFILLFTCILAGFEWLSNYLGILIHVHWRNWWSYSAWLAGLLFLNEFAKLYRRLLFKGGWKI